MFRITSSIISKTINAIIKRLKKGSSIAKIEDEAFEKLANSIRLEIEISQTEIDELPVGLFSHFNRIGRLKIVLRRNLWLSVLSPETFYSNASSWEKIGTRLLAGKSIANLLVASVVVDMFSMGPARVDN